MHGDRAHAVFAQMVLHLGDDPDRPRAVKAVGNDLDGIVDFGQFALGEFDVHDRPDDLDHLADFFLRCFFLGSCSLLFVQGFRGGDDFQKLLGDGRLPHFIQEQGQCTDHVAGVARGQVHGHHARHLFGGHGLQQDLVDGSRDVARQQRLENRVGAGLKNIFRFLRTVFFFSICGRRPFQRERKQAADGELLLRGRNEFLEGEFDTP